MFTFGRHPIGELVVLSISIEDLAQPRWVLTRQGDSPEERPNHLPVDWLWNVRPNHLPPSIDSYLSSYLPPPCSLAFPAFSTQNRFMSNVYSFCLLIVYVSSRNWQMYIILLKGCREVAKHFKAPLKSGGGFSAAPDHLSLAWNHRNDDWHVFGIFTFDWTYKYQVHIWPITYLIFHKQTK